MPDSAPLPSLATRIGLALVAPRRAFEISDEAAGRAGLTDAATLLLVKFVCVEAKTLVIALWTMVSVGVLAGVSTVGRQLTAAIGLDLVLLFGGGALVTLAAGARRRPSRDFDLAAVAWIPYLTLSIAVTLVLTLVGKRPPRQLNEMLGLIALAVYAGWLGLAIRHARQRPPVSPVPPVGDEVARG